MLGLTASSSGGGLCGSSSGSPDGGQSGSRGGSRRSGGGADSGGCAGGGWGDTRSDLSVQGSRLNVYTAEIPILDIRALKVRVHWETEDTQVPVSAVRGGADGEGTSGEDEWVGASGVPERDLVGGEVNIISNVMPNISIESNAPLSLPRDAPLQSRITGTRSTGQKTILQLREMRLKEVDLMLEISTWSISIGSLDRKVVVDVSLVDSGGSLGDQLGTSHVLSIPVGGVVDGDLDTLVGDGVGRVLVAWREIDIFGD